MFVYRMFFLQELQVSFIGCGWAIAVTQNADRSPRCFLPRAAKCEIPAKCEIILGSKAEIPLPFSGYIETQMDGLCLLGAPIFRGIALDATLEDHCRVLSRALERMIKLPSQNA